MGGWPANFREAAACLVSSARNTSTLAPDHDLDRATTWPAQPLSREHKPQALPGRRCKAHGQEYTNNCKGRASELHRACLFIRVCSLRLIKYSARHRMLACMLSNGVVERLDDTRIRQTTQRSVDQVRLFMRSSAIFMRRLKHGVDAASGHPRSACQGIRA